VTASGAPEGGARRGAVVVVIAAAVLVRVAWVALADVDPRRDFQFDMTWYDLAALRLLDGAVLRDANGAPTAFWPPGYPFLLAALYAVFGSSLLVAKLANVALAAVSTGLVYALGRRLFGARTGLAAAAIFAVLPDAVFLAPLVLSETLFTTLLCAALWLFARLEERSPPARAFPHWLSLGLLVGAALLTRGAGVALLATLALAWWAGEGLRTSLRRTAVVAAGALAVVLPWTLRNAIVMDAPILLSTSVGMSFLYAHNPIADGSESLAMVRHREEMLAPYRGMTNPEKEVAEMRAGVQAALRFMAEHPVRELLLVPRRWLHLYRHGHAGLEWARAGPGGRGAVLSPGADRVLAAVSDALFFALLALAALGLPRALRGRRAAALALPFAVASFMLLHGVLFVGNPRYHAPLLPVLSLLAACGAERLARRAHST